MAFKRPRSGKLFFEKSVLEKSLDLLPVKGREIVCRKVLEAPWRPNCEGQTAIYLEILPCGIGSDIDE